MDVIELLIRAAENNNQSENQTLKSELLGNPEQLKVEREWISVENRLPNKSDGTNVLVTNKSGVIGIAIHSWVSKLYCTHWMTLPKPPKQ